MLWIGLLLCMLKVCAVDAQQQCVVCSAGTYKVDNANSLCSPSPEGYWIGITGATLLAQATICRANSMSFSGSSAAAACICKSGYYEQDLSTCTACALGTYKVANASVSTCSACAANSITVVLGAKLASDCLCNPGYTGVTGSCAQSAAGFYKSAAGSAGSVACPDNSWSAAGSVALTDCKCNSGFTGSDGGPCSSSPAGWYKVGSAAAVQCVANSWSPAGSTAATACLCLAGYSGAPPGACTACGVGRYKEGTNNNACVNCPANSFSAASVATSALNCTACRSYSTTVSVTGISSPNDCKCDAGYYTLNMNTETATCLQCVAGKFAAQGVAACSNCGAGKFAAAGSTSSGNCVDCTAGKYSNVNQSQCDSCPANSNSPAASAVQTNCTCNAGTWPQNNVGLNGVPCTLCLAGTYKPASGPQICTPFTNNVFSSAVGSTSAGTGIACPGNSACPDASVSVVDCLWLPGYYGLTGAITSTAAQSAACVAGTFRTTAAQAGDGCTNCPANSWSNVTAKTDSTCFSCGSNSISPSGSASSAACLCSAGFGLKF